MNANRKLPGRLPTSRVKKKIRRSLQKERIHRIPSLWPVYIELVARILFVFDSHDYTNVALWYVIVRVGPLHTISFLKSTSPNLVHSHTPMSWQKTLQLTTTLRTLQLWAAHFLKHAFKTFMKPAPSQTDWLLSLQYTSVLWATGSIVCHRPDESLHQCLLLGCPHPPDSKAPEILGPLK